MYQAWLAPVDDPTAAVAVGEPLEQTVRCGMAGTPWFGLIPWISPDGTRMVAITSDDDINAVEDKVRFDGVDGTGGMLRDLTASGGISWQRVAP